MTVTLPLGTRSVALGRESRLEKLAAAVKEVGLSVVTDVLASAAKVHLGLS